MIQRLRTITILIILGTLQSVAINRVWTGAVNTDFNNVGNWTGGGSLAATDNFSIALTASGTISLTANITVNDLVFTMNTSSGATTGKLRVMGNTLTINGTATFNAPRYSNVVSYDVVKIDVSTGGSIIFNGQLNLHTTGNGDTYLTTNDLTGATGNPGCTVYFNAGVSVGTWGRTVGGYEPNMVFDATGAQTLIVKSNGGAYMFKGHNITFGNTNAPIVTVRGINAIYFDSYDGDITIGANTTVIIPDSSVVSRMSELDRYSTGAGTFSMASGSYLSLGCPNDGNGALGYPPKVIGGFSSYVLATTSTVSYNSSGWQGIQPITYGYLTLDGIGSVCDKYTTGTITVQSDWNIQNSCVFKPRVTGGSSVTVNGNTYINSSAVFNASNNNGYPNNTFIFKGNFTNNSSWTNGTTVGVSTSIFNGTPNQTIGGTSSTNFYNLTCNKSSGTLYLGIATSVGTSSTGVMSFQAGPLNLNGYVLTINNAATAAVTRTSGYAISEQNAAVNNSIIQWNINTTTGAHVFPFGRADATYIPVTFNNTGSAGNVSISTRRTTNACTSPCSTAGACNLPWAGASNVAGVTNMTSGYIPDATCSAVIDRWWNITSSLASPLAAAVSLSLTYAGDENTMSTQASQINIQHWDGSVWNAGTSAGTASGTYVNSGSTGVNAGTQTVGGSGFVYFSPYILSGNSTPLPIELVDFTARRDKEDVLLNWKTATEKNNSYFAIERSLDGMAYTEISRVPGSNTTTEPRTYSSVDPKAPASVIYYKLKQVDTDGHTNYSKVVVIGPLKTPAVSVFPNPSNDLFNIQLNATKGDHYEYELRDVTGKIILYKEGICESDLQADTFPIAFSGTYFLKVKVNNIVEHRKLIKL